MICVGVKQFFIWFVSNFFSENAFLAENTPFIGFSGAENTILMVKIHFNHGKAAKKREQDKKMAKSEMGSEQVRETDIGVSDQDYSWYLNRQVILPEQFDRALQVENDIDQGKFAQISLSVIFRSLFDHFLVIFWSFLSHFFAKIELSIDFGGLCE